ncbi:hypothetical protein Tco_1442008 [Tanacetum coccineum]
MHKLKIRDEFLKILKDNAFNGIDGGDVIDHIARVVEITEWIKVPDIDKNRLRIHVFSKSLSNDAEKWWNDKMKGRTISWDELRDQFFHKYYPLSHTCNSETLDDLDNGTDYFEFLYWLTSKFDNHWELDKTTRYGLWEFYNGNNKIINKECSPILAPARHDICDQDELCRTEEFAVVKYSVGLDKEFVAVGTKQNKHCTDIANITRKWSKLDKHEHGNG